MNIREKETKEEKHNTLWSRRIFLLVVDKKISQKTLCEKWAKMSSMNLLMESGLNWICFNRSTEWRNLMLFLIFNKEESSGDTHALANLSRPAILFWYMLCLWSSWKAIARLVAVACRWGAVAPWIHRKKFIEVGIQHKISFERHLWKWQLWHSIKEFHSSLLLHPQATAWGVGGGVSN